MFLVTTGGGWGTETASGPDTWEVVYGAGTLMAGAGMLTGAAATTGAATAGAAATAGVAAMTPAAGAAAYPAYPRPRAGAAAMVAAGAAARAGVARAFHPATASGTGADMAVAPNIASTHFIGFIVLVFC